MILGYCKSYIMYICHFMKPFCAAVTVAKCCLCTPLYTGTPLLFVIIGLAARAEYYVVHGDDGELSL